MMSSGLNAPNPAIPIPAFEVPTAAPIAKSSVPWEPIQFCTVCGERTTKYHLPCMGSSKLPTSQTGCWAHRCRNTCKPKEWGIRRTQIRHGARQDEKSDCWRWIDCCERRRVESRATSDWIYTSLRRRQCRTKCTWICTRLRDMVRSQVRYLSQIVRWKDQQGMIARQKDTPTSRFSIQLSPCPYQHRVSISRYADSSVEFGAGLRLWRGKTWITVGLTCSTQLSLGFAITFWLWGFLVYTMPVLFLIMAGALGVSSFVCGLVPLSASISST